MFREIIGGLLVVLILITGFLSYIILFEVKEIKSPSFTLNVEDYQTEPGFQTSGYEDKFKEPFNNSIDRQKEWIDRQNSINQKYEEMLGEVLFNQELLFIEEYNNDIEDKNKELKNNFQNYKREVDKLTEKKIDYYSSMVRYEKERSLENLQDNYDEEFDEFVSQVQQERQNELLNYRLKIEILDLSKAKEKEYQNKIEEIESDKRVRTNNKMHKIYSRLRLENYKVNKVMEEKIASLTEKFKEEEKELISNKQEELDNIFSIFEQNRETALEQKKEQFKTNINEERKAILNKRESIIEIATDDLEKLQSRYSTSNGERN